MLRGHENICLYPILYLFGQAYKPDSACYEWRWFCRSFTRNGLTMSSCFLATILGWLFLRFSSRFWRWWLVSNQGKRLSLSHLEGRTCSRWFYQRLTSKVIKLSRHCLSLWEKVLYLAANPPNLNQVWFLANESHTFTSSGSSMVWCLSRIPHYPFIRNFFQVFWWA